GVCSHSRVLTWRRDSSLLYLRCEIDVPPRTEGATMEIKHSGSQPSREGPAEHFTGRVRIDPLFEAPEPGRTLGVSVTFEPSARTAPGPRARAAAAGRAGRTRRGTRPRPAGGGAGGRRGRPAPPAAWAGGCGGATSSSGGSRSPGAVVLLSPRAPAGTTAKS